MEKSLIRSTHESFRKHITPHVIPLVSNLLLFHRYMLPQPLASSTFVMPCIYFEPQFARFQRPSDFISAYTASITEHCKISLSQHAAVPDTLLHYDSPRPTCVNNLAKSIPIHSVYYSIRITKETPTRSLPTQNSRKPLLPSPRHLLRTYITSYSSSRRSPLSLARATLLPRSRPRSL